MKRISVLFRNTHVPRPWFLLGALLLLVACDNVAISSKSAAATAAPVATDGPGAANVGVVTNGPESALQKAETFNEAEALLADERNTVDVVNAFGPSVVAINVTIEGEPMRPFDHSS